MNRRKFLYLAPIGIAGLAAADAFAIEPNWIDYSEERFGKGTSVYHKIIQLSDLHLSAIEPKHEEIAKKINTIKPQYVVITGDTIDRNEALPILDEFLSKIEHSIHKIAVLGNWEWWGKVNIAQLNITYRKHNCVLLVNESVSFQIDNLTTTFVGIDDLVGGFPDFETSFSNIKPNERVIVLAHCPAHFEKIDEFVKTRAINVDAVLSGHTHGGQVNVFGFIPFLPPGSGEYLKGWYRKNNIPMYVSRGVGMTILPIRFGSRPEVPVFDYYIA